MFRRKVCIQIQVLTSINMNSEHTSLLTNKQFNQLKYYIYLNKDRSHGCKHIVQIFYVKHNISTRILARWVSGHPVDGHFLYLIIPFWYALVAYQPRLVEPWLVFWRDAVKPKYLWRDQTSLICRWNIPKRYDSKDIYRTHIRPSDRDILAIIGSVTWYLRISEQATRLLIG